MTSAQQSAYWRLWSAACKAQGWTRENGLDAAAIDHHRKECLAECGFESSKDIDSGAGFSRWKSLCERLSGKLVGAVHEVHQNTPADRRRWVIENEMIPCIAWYAPETTRDRLLYARNYVAAIIRATIGTVDLGAGQTGTPSLTDLDESELTRLMATLNARLGAKRRSAGHSIHDMLTGAGCRCRCAACKPLATAAAASTTDADQPF